MCWGTRYCQGLVRFHSYLIMNLESLQWSSWVMNPLVLFSNFDRKLHHRIMWLRSCQCLPCFSFSLLWHSKFSYAKRSVSYAYCFCCNPPGALSRASSYLSFEQWNCLLYWVFPFWYLPLSPHFLKLWTLAWCCVLQDPWIIWCASCW